MSSWIIVLASALVTTTLPAHADLVRLMKTGDVAAVQLHHDLTHARRTIDVSTYIWEPCSIIGRALLNDLRERARHGVRVRVLLDAYVHPPDLRRDLTAELAADGIELRYFNARAAYDLMNNRRMHAKIIVVDQRSYYLGGRNIADDYFDMGTSNWIDRDVAVTGASARSAQADFEKLWGSDLTAAETEGPTADFARWRAACFAPTDGDRRFARVLASEGAAIFASTATHRCTDVRTATDDPDFYDAPGRIYLPGLTLKPDQYRRKHATREVVDFVAGAEDLTAENYTYVPEGLLATAIDDLRARGAKFDLFTNAVMDQPPLQFLKEESVLRDNQGTERIFELSALGSVAFPWAMTPAGARWSIHTKAMAAGPSVGRRRHGLVGSFNFDPRSYATNLESAVVVRDCPAFAEDLQASMTRLLEFHARDRSCTACQEKPEISLGDQLSGTLGRPLYFRGPR